MKRLGLVALACYATGYGVGTLASWWTWATTTHEHYQLPKRTR